MPALNSVLQENFLILLLYDDKRSKIIRNTVEIRLFGGLFRDIAMQAYDYIDSYKEAPKAHIWDLMEYKIKSENKREAKHYKELLSNLEEAYIGINAEFIMTQLEKFVNRQSLRSISVDLQRLLQEDTDTSIEEAQELLAINRNRQLEAFRPGLRLSDIEALDFLDEDKNESIPLKIPELDRRGLVPTKGETLLMIGDAKAGKTQFLTHVAKMALMHRWKVVHITLEMGEKKMSQRYYQGLFGVAKRNEELVLAKLLKNKAGKLKGVEEKILKPKHSLDSETISEELAKFQKDWSDDILSNIIVRQFPTSQLTVKQLEAYLENLESTAEFVPDLVILDYPDLMKLDPKNLRMELDGLYKELRGLSVERNFALVIVSQAHRQSSGAKLVKGSNVAEAYQKIAHCDLILTYTQTEQERQLGLARLYVAGGRNDSDKFAIVIAQNYAMAQFVIDSAMMSNKYWSQLEEQSPQE